MEKKEYIIKEANPGTQPVLAYQSEINIKQAKQLELLFAKHDLGKEFTLDKHSWEFLANLREKGIENEVIKILVRNAQGREVDELNYPDILDEMTLNTQRYIITDFFIMNPGLIVLFGTTCVQAALTLAKTSLIPTENGSMSGSLPSSEKISEEEKSLKSGTGLTDVSADALKSKENTLQSSTDSQTEEEAIIRLPNI